MWFASVGIALEHTTYDNKVPLFDMLKALHSHNCWVFCTSYIVTAMWMLLLSFLYREALNIVTRTFEMFTEIAQILSITFKRLCQLYKK